MDRAAVLIGVSRSGHLPRLRAVLPGIRDMAAWAARQGFGRVTTLTDEAGPVRVRDVQDAVGEILRAGPPEQLLVYFAGHGVNVGRSEFWLLSEAPRFTNEAVNVAGSAHLARSCGVEHVVFVSDACRTAAAGLHVQAVTGSDVFPNEEFGPTNRPVDLFYACALGSPAYEIPDPETAAGRFSAVYTATLVDALDGRPATLLDWEVGDDGVTGVVRPWPLCDHLESEVARRMARTDPSGALVQVPEAVITSRPSAWLSRIPWKPPLPPEHSGWPPMRPGGIGEHPPMRPGGRPTTPADPVEFETGPVDVGPATLGALARAALRDELARGHPAELLAEAVGRGVPGADLLLRATERGAGPFGPGSVGTRCGVKVRGTHVVSAEGPGLDAEVAGPDRALVRVTMPRRAPATVLLRLGDGTSVALPALDGFVAAVTVEGSEVVDVAYEPSTNSVRFDDYVARLDDIRSLRSLISASSRLGTFRLGGDDAQAVARRMQLGKGVDPSLALYAAYAYHELQRDDLLSDMLDHLEGDLDAGLFDVALLAGGLAGRPVRAPVVPVVPMLAQGWALLDAHGVALPAPVDRLRRHLVPSLWTQFDAAAFDEVREALHSTGGRL